MQQKSYYFDTIDILRGFEYLTMLVFIAFISPHLLFQHLFLNLGSHLLFLHNLVPQWHGAINGSNWSLATEMQFYVLMLLIAPWLRVGRWWGIALVFLITAWLWRAGVTAWVQPSESSGFFPVFVAATQLPGILDEFLAGLLLARLVSYLGTISYGIYLWYLPVLLSLKTLDWLKPELALMWCLVITCILASVSWHFFEKPLMDRFNPKANIQ